MNINTTPTAPVTLNFVENFTYLGNLIKKDNGAQKDKARPGKALCVFAKL